MNEIYLLNYLRALTFRRALNLIKTNISLWLSAILNRHFVWGKPAQLTIEPTNICNLKCPLCTTGSGEMQRPGGKMDIQTYSNILEKMGDDIFFLLLYHQGEPYINKNFLKFVEMAKARNIYTTTSTNAHYFDDETIHATIDSGLDSMIVSLDGLTQDVYEKYRVKGKVDKVIDSARRFMEIKKERGSKTPIIALQFLVMKHNEQQLNDVKKLAREIGVDRLLIKNIEVHNVQEANEWLPADDRYRRYNFDGQTLKVKNQSRTSCPRVWKTTLINWDGTFVPCCFDKNGEFPMGNINDKASFSDIWQGKTFDNFRKKLIHERETIDMCHNCNQGLDSFMFTWHTKKRKKNQVSEKPLFPILKQH